MWSGARGNIFEKHYAHDQLQLKGCYRTQQFINPLTKKRADKNKRADAICILDLPAASGGSRGIHNPDDIASIAADEYGQPDHTVFPTIDSARKPNMLFQITAGATHDVNIDGLVAGFAKKRGAGAAGLSFSPPPLLKKQLTGAAASDVSAVSILRLPPLTQHHLSNPHARVPHETRNSIPIHIKSTDKWSSQSRKYIKEHPEYLPSWDSLRTAGDGSIEFTLDGTTWKPV